MIGQFIEQESTEPRMYSGGAVPSRIHQARLGAPSMVTLDSGITVEAPCLCCTDTPCARYGPEETNAVPRLETTRDTHASVCAFDAIVVNDRGHPPKISTSDCAS